MLRLKISPSSWLPQKQWAAFLPEFDATYHDLSNLKVDVYGDSASAFVDITASHWLGDEGFWAVSGNYENTIPSIEIVALPHMGDRIVSLTYLTGLDHG